MQLEIGVEKIQLRLFKAESIRFTDVQKEISREVNTKVHLRKRHHYSIYQLASGIYLIRMLLDTGMRKTQSSVNFVQPNLA
ncbi:MAG: hypothetical protein ACI8YQ_000537 [Polaribacter sp.]|jgi:hypothetical protein